MALIKIALAAGLLATVSISQAAAVFTSRAAWEAAIGGSSATDAFDADVPGAAILPFASGIVSTAAGPFADFAFGNSISGGMYNGSVDNDSTAGFLTITWTFPAPVTAFGADWFATALGVGILQILGNFDGAGDIVVEPGTVLGGDGTGFLGVQGAAPFTEVRFRSSHPLNNENYQVDNVSFRFAAAIPEPSTLLLGVAVLGAALPRRRRIER